MTKEDEISDEKLQYDLTKKQQKSPHYHQVKLRNINILQVKKYYLLMKEKRQNMLSLHILI